MLKTSILRCFLVFDRLYIEINILYSNPYFWQVIQKFETASKSSSELNILNSAISAHLMQDTVSSRLKKISAEEFTAMERKASAGKTGERNYCGRKKYKVK